MTKTFLKDKIATLSRVLRSWCSCARSCCSLVTGNCSRSLDRCRPQRNLEPCSPSSSWRNLPIIVIACKKWFSTIIHSSNLNPHQCNSLVQFGRQMYFLSILSRMCNNNWLPQAQINSRIWSWLQKQANIGKYQTVVSKAFQPAGLEAAKLCHLYWVRGNSESMGYLSLTTNTHNSPARKGLAYSISAKRWYQIIWQWIFQVHLNYQQVFEDT